MNDILLNIEHIVGFMFANLPFEWRLFGVFVVCCLLFFIYKKLSAFFAEYFKPFKKGKTYWCKVTAVSDGDTITCRRLNLRRSYTKIRFAYIDAPESSQSFGQESRKIVVSLIHKKMVRVRITDTDRYGRHVGEIYRRRKNINEELVKCGAAWVYEDYIRDKKKAERLKKLQAEAKRKKLGLWKSARPIRPSDYRQS